MKYSKENNITELVFHLYNIFFYIKICLSSSGVYSGLVNCIYGYIRILEEYVKYDINTITIYYEKNMYEK